MLPGDMAFEVVHSEVFFSLSFRVPEDGNFDSMDVCGIDLVDLVLAVQRVTTVIVLARIIESDTNQRFHQESSRERTGGG